MNPLVITFIASLLALRSFSAEVRLEDLKIPLVKQGAGMPHADKSVNGLPMQMGGQKFAYGLGTHAPSLAVVKLDGNADRFRATVGINDETGRSEKGSVEFFVIGDGKILFRSDIIRSGDKPMPVDVALAGVETLVLHVSDGGDNYFSDHANWADAVIVYSGGDPAMTAETVRLPTVYPPPDERDVSPGNTTYYIDPERGNDKNIGTNPNSPWQSPVNLNALRLAPGDRVELRPGRYEYSLHVAGAGTVAKPIVIQFVKGKYEFYRDRALKRQLHISNANDDPNTSKAIALALDGVKHVRIEGAVDDGWPRSEVIIHGQMIETFFDAVEDVKVSGLGFDYLRPTMSEYTVTAVAEDHADIVTHQDSLYEIKEGELTWLGEGWSYLAKGSTDKGNLVQIAIPSEARTWRWGNPWDAVTRVEELEPRKIRLHFVKNAGFTVDHVYQIRAIRRNCAGNFSRDSKDLGWRDCAFYYMHGLGFVNQFCENLTLDRCWFAPRPGSGRTCASWADAVHLSGVKGKVAVTGCTFRGLHDDAINVHGTYLRVMANADGNRVVVRFMHNQTFGFRAFRAGDTVAVVRAGSLKEISRNKVLAVEMKGDHEMILDLESPLDADPISGIVLENITWNPEIIVRSCLVEATPSYGFVLKSRAPILVEDCTFRGTHMSAVAMAAYVDTTWYESCPVHEVVIKGNRFLASQGPPVIINPGNTKDEGPVCENVRVVNNFFGQFPNEALNAKSVKGLTFINNRFAAGKMPEVVTTQSMDVKIGNNRVGQTDDKEPPTAAELQAMQLKQADRSRQGPHNPHPDAQWFPGAGLGLFIHWGIAAIHGDGDLSWAMLANKPWVDGTITPNTYWGLINGWKTDKLDFDKMLGAAKAAGFAYAVMVTKHHDGFTFWPSESGDIGTSKTFGGRDFVQEFVDACRKHGLKVGFYYSPPDWWFDRLYRSFSWAGPALDMDHKPVNLPPKPAGHDEARRNQVRGQLRELLTRYGKIDLIWFDGGQGEMPNADVRKLQPGIVINMRNGRGDYGDSESSLPEKRFNGWFETCLPCWPKRSWSYNKNYGSYDAATTLTMTVLLRAWGGNLLANVGPKGDGSLPDNTLMCWSEMAQWMSHSREAVAGTNAGPWPEKVNLPVTLGDGAAYIHFLPMLSEKVTGLPPEVKDWTSMRKIIKNYPWDSYSATAVWNDAPEPMEITLLRTGDKIPFSYENHTLTVTIPVNLRTSSVDVVKVRYAAEPGQAGATVIDKPLLKECGLMEGTDGLITRAPSPEPSAAQKWQIANTRYGMFIHYGINTFINQEWSDGTVPVEKYAPKEIDANGWVLAAKNAGMSHVVLICKHHDGFCIWPTKVDETKYSVAHTANPTDVVKTVSDACRKFGMHFAIYYSLWDRRWDSMHADDYKKNSAATDIAYTDYMISQLRELLTQYGDVTELWFDGPWQKLPERWHYDRVYDAIKRCQPRCQVAINWCIGDPRQAHLAGTIHPGNQKTGDYIRYFPCDFRLGDPYLPSVDDPKVFSRDNHSYYMPFESTVCLNNKWFWNVDDHELKSVNDLEQLYRRATANDNMLLLNSPPGPDGHMRPGTIKRLVELRERLGLPVGGPGWKR